MARSNETLERLVAQLQINCGDMYAACRATGVSVLFVTKWAKDDKEVAEQLAEAERVGSYGLESEAIRRAVHGDEKGVYFKGERVGTEYNRSDGLLQTLLKGRLTDRYGKEGEGSGGITVHGQAQINIMPRANNYDEWLRMKDSTLALRARDAEQASQDAMKLLNPPEQTIDVIGVPVHDDPFGGLGI